MAEKVEGKRFPQSPGSHVARKLPHITGEPGRSM